MYALHAPPYHLPGANLFPTYCGSSHHQALQQAARCDDDDDDWLSPLGALDEDNLHIMQLLGCSSSVAEETQKPQRAAADGAAGDAAAGAAAAAGQASCFSSAEQEQVLMLLNPRICQDAPSRVPVFDPQQQFLFISNDAAAAAAAAGGTGVKRCSADGVTTSSHSSLIVAGRLCCSTSDTAAAPNCHAGSPKAQQKGAWQAGACSPGAVSAVQDPEEPSSAADGVVAALTTSAAAAAGCATGTSAGKRSKEKAGSQAAAGAGTANASNPPATRRVRQRRYNELVALKEELATVTAKQAGTESRLDSLRSENSRLLTCLADITSRWQATVADNAWLAREASESKALVSVLQQRLAAYEQQPQQAAAAAYPCGNAN